MSGRKRWYAPEAVALLNLGCSVNQIAKRYGLNHGQCDDMLSQAVVHRRGYPTAPARNIPCLCCGAPFPSAGRGNRLCVDCRSGEAW